MGVDYGEAVSDGKVTHPGEFEEMQDFSQGIIRQIADLPEGTTRDKLARQGARLAERVLAKADPESARCHSSTQDGLGPYQTNLSQRRV